MNKVYQVEGSLLNAILNALALLPYKDSVAVINEILKLNQQHPETPSVETDKVSKPRAKKVKVLEGEVVNG